MERRPSFASGSTCSGWCLVTTGPWVSLQEGDLNPFQRDVFSSLGSRGHLASQFNQLVVSQDSERAVGVSCSLETSQYQGSYRNRVGTSAQLGRLFGSFK